MVLDLEHFDVVFSFWSRVFRHQCVVHIHRVLLGVGAVDGATLVGSPPLAWLLDASPVEFMDQLSTTV